jgi:hypothetical protein
VTGRRGKILNQLLDDIKKKRGHWKLKEEALDHTVWRTRVGSGCGPVIKLRYDDVNIGFVFII